MFLAVSPERATLSDANDDLIRTFVQVRDNPEPVISLLQGYEYSSEFYYSMRALSPSSPSEHAARFIYLNRTCWNGLYRVNKKGEFNVPFGSFKNPDYIVADRIRSFACALQGAIIERRDFGIVVDEAVAGDTVYLDPPYTVTHGNNGFLRYNEQIFSWDDQMRLADVARALDTLGCTVVLTNADHESIHALYSGFSVSRLDRRSLVAADAKHRAATSELLITNRE